MSENSDDNTDLGLAGAEYMRERIAPRRGDFFYIHLSDLLKGIRKSLPLLNKGKYLDFGCGGSPYRKLFVDAASYHRADLQGTPDIDYVIPPNSRLDVEKETYDQIISTQVLEHVANVPAYLAECSRLLKPGGKILITTHGTFPDHACPHDFHRWTADGLCLELSKAGLKPIQTLKLSTGPRALLFQMQMFQTLLLSPNWSPSGILMRILRWPFRHASMIDRLCDELYSENAVVDHTTAQLSSSLYIGILVVGEKSRTEI